MGVEVQVYDPKFVTDLLTAEYRGLVDKLKSHQRNVAEGLQMVVSSLASNLDAAGLAQIESKLQAK